MKNRIWQTLTAIFASLLLTSAVLAQNVTLRGQVVDELGAVIPNAEVTLTGPDGKTRTAKSNVAGEFSLANVPPGVYSVTSAYEGFDTYLDKAVKVPLATPTLTIVMKVKGLDIVTDVTANNVNVSTEPDQNMNAIVLNEDFVKSLPDNEDDLRDFLNALVGPTAAGGSGNGAEIFVDGFSGGRLPPKEAIMQIRVNQNPFSAEFANPGFNRVEIITKPGNDRWRGSGGFGYRNSALDARNAFALVKPDLTNSRYNFNFGGPVIKKRMSATIFADRNVTDGSNTTVATTLDGPYVANVPSKTVSHFVGTRTDFLLNDKNTLNLSYNYRKSESFNQEFAQRFGGGFGGFGGGGGGGFGGGGFGGGGAGTSLRLPESASNRENNNHNLRLSETWIVNAKMIHEARFQFSRDRSDQIAVTKGLAINVLDSFQGGGSTCCPNLSTQDEYEYQDYLTYTTKGSKHTIKGGIQLQYQSFADVSGSNFNGTFTFSSLDQYRRALADPNDPLGRATQFTVNQGNPNLDYGMFFGSWFVGDDWRVKQNFTLSFGLRHEFQNRISDQVNFAPRIGIAWSPFKSRKTTIRGGGGIFFDRLRNGQYENSIRFNGQLQQSFLVRNAIYASTLAEALRLNQGQLTQTQNTTQRPLDAGLKQPYDVNLSVTLEQQLPQGWVGTVTYLFSRGINQFRTRNINAPYPDPADPTKLIRPFPNAGQIFQTESSAISETNRLNFGFRRQAGKLMLFGGYTLSWINSNGEGTPANSYDLSSEWGRSNADRRHNLFTGTMWSLPYGFRTNTTIIAGSGSPFNITTGRDDNLDGTINDRPVDANGRVLQRNANLPTSFYSLAQFSRLICPPGKTCVGDTGRIQLRDFLQQKYPNGVIAQGPGNFIVNLNVSRTFGFGKNSNNNNQAQAGQGGMGGPGGGGRGGGGGGFGGGGGRGGGGFGGGGPMMMGGFGGGESSRYNLTLSVGISNLFNRVNFQQYSGTLGTAYFGIPSGANAARQFDFNVRFNF
ncbi:MAG: carboxypeptidase regulatory-like domain-containing protein [Acidobacteriota bacterium]